MLGESFDSSVPTFPMRMMILCVHAERLQPCTTLCNPMDCRPPGSSVHGILLARILEWVAMSFPGDLPDSGVEPTTLMSPTLAGSSPLEQAGKPHEDLGEVFYSLKPT